MAQDTWDPKQYEKFRTERTQPFFDLAALVRPATGMRVVDLGCGTGELTVLLSERLAAREVLGIDSSPAMLAKAAPRAGGVVRFARGDIAEFDDVGAFDLVFSHAALQWVPEHERLFARLLGGLRPGAQLAVQMPNNYGHASHLAAAEVARSPRFAGALGGFVKAVDVLSLERYAELFHAHGLREMACVEKVYGHELANTEAVVEWTKGTLLTAYLSRLDEATGAAFVEAYRERVVSVLGAQAPYFYPFRRVLLWGRKG